MRTTRTYAVLKVSPEAYTEIRRALNEAGYQHAFIKEGADEVVDMHGIALSSDIECRSMQTINCEECHRETITTVAAAHVLGWRCDPQDGWSCPEHA